MPRPALLRPRRGSHRLRLCSPFALGPGVLSLLLVALPAPLQGDSGPPSFVGKRMPGLQVEKWYSERVPLPTLEGKPWVLALIRLNSAIYPEAAKVIRSLHRPLEQGGPVVIAYTKESPKEIESALSRMKEKPDFPLASDRRFITHLTLKVDTFPYFYVVGADGLVKWQGNPSAALFSAVRELGGTPRPMTPAPGKEPGAEGEETEADTEPDGQPRLPSDYRQQVEEALERKKDRRRRVELLLMAYRGTERPKNPLLERLWERVTADIADSRESVEKRIARKSYSRARRTLGEALADSGDHPSAEPLHELRGELAALECKAWLARAEEARKEGDLDEARAQLNRIIRYYGDLEWGEKAKKLLTELEK